MKRVMHLIVAGLLATGVLSTAFASAKAPAKKAAEPTWYFMEASGEVVSVDNKAHTFVLKETFANGSMTRELDFGLCKHVEITIKGKTIPFENLKVGEKVTVYYTGFGGKLEGHMVTTA